MENESYSNSADLTIKKFVQKFIEVQEPLDPEFEKVFRDNWLEMLA